MPSDEETQVTARNEDTGGLKEALGRIPALPAAVRNAVMGTYRRSMAAAMATVNTRRGRGPQVLGRDDAAALGRGEGMPRGVTQDDECHSE